MADSFAARWRRATRFVLAAALAAGTGITIGAHTAGAAPLVGGNFIATGHDMDFHCSGESPAGVDAARSAAIEPDGECAYFKIVVDKVRNGSTKPVLALDMGSKQVKAALDNIGVTSYEVVDASDATAVGAVVFNDGAGAPRYSALITGSDQTCGGCDLSVAAEANVKTRSADIAKFYNAGGGILALAGAENAGTYYGFVPLTGVVGKSVTSPFKIQPPGAALGATDAMANCCPTHNSFDIPPSPLIVLETDSASPTPLAETIAAFGATITDGGFTPPPTVPVTPLPGVTELGNRIIDVTKWNVYAPTVFLVDLRPELAHDRPVVLQLRTRKATRRHREAFASLGGLNLNSVGDGTVTFRRHPRKYDVYRVVDAATGAELFRIQIIMRPVRGTAR